MVAASAIRLGGVSMEGDDVYWTEGRPHEKGRVALVRRDRHGGIADVTPAGTNVRTRVHEYGGAAYVVSGGTIYFTEFSDQRLYALTPGGTPQPLTPEGRWHHADCTVDPRRPRLVCVREDHTNHASEATTTLVSVSLHDPGSAPLVIESGYDFYSTPRFSPDGARLAWLAWRHPQMPWDGSELWVAAVGEDGSLGPRQLVAGSASESIFQPGWSPDGSLYFVSDRTGWWNLYRLRGGDIEPVWPMEAEFGRPQWTLGTTTWAAIDQQRLAVAHAKEGRWRLSLLDRSASTLVTLGDGLHAGEVVAASPTHVALLAGTPSAPDGIFRIDLESGAVELLRAAAEIDLDPGILSPPEPIAFPTDGGGDAYAIYYPPSSAEWVGPRGEHPPLIVVAHGGPTAASNARLNLELQYWTSRGFAVVDVNYGGSTGYGRTYRQRLNGTWGIVDVADCTHAAQYLASLGWADPHRVLIRGRSAGGYTTLAALTTVPASFAAGASYYGVADLELLARETHKFESRYLDTLIGPYPAMRERYVDRSPLNRLEVLSSPLILFQGADDLIVPRSQAELTARAAREKGLPVALLVFPGEQHGFRHAETIVKCLEAELAFYAAVLGLTLPEALPAVPIENLDGWRAAPGT
jgi:dipeptidyl aminopeptidase/acylaminoacyl peptidase